MELRLHKDISADRWSELTLEEQLGNVGSEVSRLMNWQSKDDKIQSERAFERLLELMDLTINDQRWTSCRRELTRTREVLCDAYFGGHEYNGSWTDLDKYFMHFALAARKNL